MNTNNQTIAAAITTFALQAANDNKRKAADEWPLLRALRRANSRILRENDSPKIFIAIAQAVRKDGLRASSESEKGLNERIDGGDWFDFGTINTDAKYTAPWGFDDGSGEYVSPSMGLDTTMRLADVKTDDDGKFVAAPDGATARLRTSRSNKLVEMPVSTPEWWTVTLHHIAGAKLPFGDLSATTWTAGEVKTTTEMREHIEGGKKTGKPLKRINLQYTIETRRVVATFPGGTAIFREERIIPDGKPSEFKTKLIRTTFSNRVDGSGYHPSRDLLPAEAKVDAVQRMEKLRSALGEDLWNALWRLCIDQVEVSAVGEGDKREAEATGAMIARLALRIATRVYVSLIRGDRAAEGKPIRKGDHTTRPEDSWTAPTFFESLPTGKGAGFPKFETDPNPYRKHRPPVFADGLYGAAA